MQNAKQAQRENCQCLTRLILKENSGALRYPFYAGAHSPPIGLQTKENVAPRGKFRPVENNLKADFSLNQIFDIPMRPVREDERHRRRFTR